ncbi:MAG: reductive dehalogenase [Calditrichaeota bacterium]|nr:reductive dehalogenase [Calditrichota bacterium]
MGLTSIVNFFFLLVTIFYSLLAAGFLITFFLEKNFRALNRGLLIFIPTGALLFTLLFSEFPLKNDILATVDLLAFLFAVAMFVRTPAPLMRKDERQQQRVDERDALFHRFYFLRPGMPEFNAYYQSHQEKRKTDDAIRRLPNLGESGSRGYHPINSLFQTATFDIIGRINRPAYFTPEKKSDFPVGVAPAEMTQRLKGYARYLGADLVGVTELNPAYVYSHNARGEGDWGAPIELNHKYAIAIAVEMKSEMIRQAPDVAVSTESSLRYMDTAKIALIMARFISLLGYDARAHIDGNYRVMCIPIAVDAGLGELGRLGLLVTPKYGARIRLSVVTTDLAVTPDKPIAFGVQHFCEICKKCARNCPSASISNDEKIWVKGVEKWQSQQDTCYRFWRLQGSDCSICINECPYSYPTTPMHNLTRALVKNNNFSRRLSYWGDRLFYGRRNKSSLPLPDWHKK